MNDIMIITLTVLSLEPLRSTSSNAYKHQTVSLCPVKVPLQRKITVDNSLSSSLSDKKIFK